jgi:LPXTG-motif cell wall-anchored protein
VVETSTCLFGTVRGGWATSEGWAGLIGLLLLAIAAFLAVRWRRRLLLLFAGYVAIYVLALVVLWYVSKAVWGPVRCMNGHF